MRSPACFLLYPENRLGFQGFAPCARVAGTLVYFTSPSRIYRFKRFLLCVARVAAPFGGSVHFVNPPATHQDINSQTAILPTITLFSVVFSFFHHRRRMPAKFLYSLHEDLGPARTKGYLFPKTWCRAIKNEEKNNYHSYKLPLHL